MRKITGVMMAVCLIVSLFSGVVMAENKPLSLSETKVLFGTLKEGVSAVKHVTLKNIGGSTIQIKNVKTS